MIRVASERPGPTPAEPREPPEPVDEASRQAAVERSGILGRRGDRALQHIVETASRTYHAGMGLISIIDRGRQWFAARTGIEPEETPRADSFCLHAIRRPGEPLVVLDAETDRRFASNPLVQGPPHVRFYAGVPLLDQAGYPLGALCVMDDKPRPFMPSLFQLIRLTREAEKIIAR
jgi:GAF domain-containing protein